MIDWSKHPTKVYVVVDGRKMVLSAGMAVCDEDGENLTYATVHKPGPIKYLNNSTWTKADLLPLKKYKVEGDAATLKLTPGELIAVEDTLNKKLEEMAGSDLGIARVKIRLVPLEPSEKEIMNQALEII